MHDCLYSKHHKKTIKSIICIQYTIHGREGLLHNKPVQGLRLTNCITGFTSNQLKIDRWFSWFGVNPVIQFVNLRPCTGLLCNKPSLPSERTVTP